MPINETVQVILIVVITGLARFRWCPAWTREYASCLSLIWPGGVAPGAGLVPGSHCASAESFVENTGGYLSELVSKTFNLTRMNPSRATGWGAGHYYTGMVAFMVAVCRYVHCTRFPRQTIREFVTGVLFVPAGFTLM